MRPTAKIVGAGPNGLAAAIVLAKAGFAEGVQEAASIAGSGVRLAELTLPGFRECILARAVFNPEAMNQWNENRVGGEINGGSVSGLQFFLRPTWRQYATPIKGVYLCSSSAPPGGAVHGMCG